MCTPEASNVISRDRNTPEKYCSVMIPLSCHWIHLHDTHNHSLNAAHYLMSLRQNKVADVHQY